MNSQTTQQQIRSNLINPLEQRYDDLIKCVVKIFSTDHNSSEELDACLVKFKIDLQPKGAKQSALKQSYYQNLVDLIDDTIANPKALEKIRVLSSLAEMLTCLYDSKSPMTHIFLAANSDLQTAVDVNHTSNRKFFRQVFKKSATLNREVHPKNFEETRQQIEFGRPKAINEHSQVTPDREVIKALDQLIELCQLSINDLSKESFLGIIRNFGAVNSLAHQTESGSYSLVGKNPLIDRALTKFLQDRKASNLFEFIKGDYLPIVDLIVDLARNLQARINSSGS